MCLHASFKTGGKVTKGASSCPAVHRDVKKIVPRNFVNGAKVKKHHKNIPASLVKTGDTDMVLARVQAGELVINKKNVPMVERFLRSKGVKLPGMK